MLLRLCGWRGTRTWTGSPATRADSPFYVLLFDSGYDSRTYGLAAVTLTATFTCATWVHIVDFLPDQVVELAGPYPATVYPDAAAEWLPTASHAVSCVSVLKTMSSSDAPVAWFASNPISFEIF